MLQKYRENPALLEEQATQDVFLVGAKSLGAYGGYETFVNKLTEYHQYNNRLKYHVACKANGDGCMDESLLHGVSKIVKDKKGKVTEFTYHNARCFKVRVPNIGSMQAVYYDIVALWKSCQYIKENNISHPIIYIMACRIGPIALYFQRKVHKLGGKIYLNPDGHEWMRAKWSKSIRKYWKISEQLMVRYSDLVICDSVSIEKYIHECYDGKGIGKSNPQTTYIAYGAETRKSNLADDDTKLLEWYQRNGLSVKEYYLVVGRFVPENNYETMICEFMRSKTKRSFALITNVSDKFMEELKVKTGFDKDSRIKFVGTVYEQELLMKIRENAYGYFHGHEVGGTNPSLLEALGSTDINLLLNVGFNRECGEDGALYWNKESGALANLIEKADAMTKDEIDMLGKTAHQRIKNWYSWDYISSEYESVFIGGKIDQDEGK